MTRWNALVDPGRFVRFASVGIVGAMVDLAVSTTLLLGYDVRPELAKFVGAEVAIVLMFLINDRWTFEEVPDRGWLHRLRRLIKSNLVRSGGIAVQLVVVFVLTRLAITIILNGTDWWPVFVMPIAIGSGFLVNYIGETLLTWRVHRTQAGPGDRG